MLRAATEDLARGGSMDERPDWKNHGVRIVRSGELDTNTPQTRGMTRAEAISHARVGAQKLWAGTVTVHPRDPRRVYGISKSGQVFGTNDGGDSWTERRLPDGVGDCYAIACG